MRSSYCVIYQFPMLSSSTLRCSPEYHLNCYRRADCTVYIDITMLVYVRRASKYAENSLINVDFRKPEKNITLTECVCHWEFSINVSSAIHAMQWYAMIREWSFFSRKLWGAKIERSVIQLWETKDCIQAP